jgi:hypothetical protein
MISKIFKDFLSHFNHKINSRKAVLLIDGFRAHQTGIDLLEAEDIEFPNLKIRFLPVNATSLYQSLN